MLMFKPHVIKQLVTGIPCLTCQAKGMFITEQRMLIVLILPPPHQKKKNAKPVFRGRTDISMNIELITIYEEIPHATSIC